MVNAILIVMKHFSMNHMMAVIMMIIVMMSWVHPQRSSMMESSRNLFMVQTTDPKRQMTVLLLHSHATATTPFT